MEKDNCFYQPLIPNKHMSSISVLNEEVGDVLGGLMTDQRKGAEGKQDSGYLCSQLSREALCTRERSSTFIYMKRNQK